MKGKSRVANSKSTTGRLKLILLVLVVFSVGLHALLRAAALSSPSGPNETSAAGQGSGLTPATSPLTGKLHVRSTVRVTDLSAPSGLTMSTIPLLTPTTGQSTPPSPNSRLTVVAAATSITSMLSVSGFSGISQTQSSCGGCRPPDVQVAAGPDHLLEMVNMEGEVFSKRGVSLKMFALADFFNSGSDSLSDPKILFDVPTGAWFASLVDVTTGEVLLGVSTSPNPLGTWNTYSLQTGGRLPDQPIIGLNDDKLVVSANIFTISPLNYYGAQYWVLDKAQIVVGSSLVDYSSYGPDPGRFSIHPVQSLGPTATEFMVSTGISAGTSVELFAVTGPARTATVNAVNITIAPLTPPPGGSQPGTTSVVDSGDSRVLDAAWFQGMLWLTLDDGCIPRGDTTMRTCVRMIELDTSSSAVLQDFDIGAAGSSYFYPALRIDASGGVAVLYGFSNQTVYPSLAATGRSSNDPVGAVRAPTVLVQGTASDTSLRYGDYFGAALDPSDQMLVWLAGEYHNSTLGTCDGAGSCWSTWISSVRVDSVGYSVAIGPTYLATPTGGKVSSTATLNSLGGFSGTVSLTASVSAFGVKATVNPKTVSVLSQGIGTINVLVATTNSTLPGTYIVSLSSTSGSLRVGAIVVVMVTGFAFTGSQKTLALPNGSQTIWNVTLTSVGGFSGPVAFQASPVPNRLSVATPASVTLSPGNSTVLGTVIAAPSGVAVGPYAVNLTGTSGPQWHSLLVSVEVTPITVPVNGSNLLAGVMVHTSGSVSVDAPATMITVSGSLAVRAVDNANGSVLFSNSYAVDKLPLSQLGQGSFGTKFLVQVKVSPVPLTVDVVLTITGTSSSVSLDLTRALDIDGDGFVNGPDSTAVVSAFGCALGSTCYDPRADLRVDGAVDVLDLALLSSYFGAVDLLPDFSLSGNTSRLTVTVGSSASSLLTVSSLNSFTGVVSLNASTSSVSKGIHETLTPSLVLIAPGIPKTTSLVISAANSAVPGNYLVVMTGSSGSKVRSISMMISIVDFSIVASPSQVTVSAGVPATSSIILGGLNGFAGNVTLSISSASSWVSASLTPGVLPIQSASPYAFSVLSVATQTRDGVVTVVGVAGSVMHSFRVVVRLMDFSITALPASLSIVQGSVGYSTIALSSLNGFSGTIFLNATITSSGAAKAPPSVSLTATSVVLSPGVVGVSYLRIATTRNTTTGSYTIAVAGSGGGLSHTAFVALTVTV